MLENLDLNVATGLAGATEHGWAADNNGAGPVPGRHALDKIFKSLEDPGVLVGRDDERIAFLLEDGRCTFDCWID